MLTLAIKEENLDSFQKRRTLALGEETEYSFRGT